MIFLQEIDFNLFIQSILFTKLVKMILQIR